MCRGGAGPELAAAVTGMSSIQRWVCSLVNGHVFSCFPLPEVKRAIMYQALYRKYRPKTFDDVVGQEHITETLKKQVETGRLSHAYLFIGTRGTGKTTCAKILAKAVNCEHPVNGNPCNQCAACRGIDDGSILDVVELDAASNNGVDNVRALRDEAVFSPANVRKRVYIIDEVHMLSTSAFNALLKILEEPPAHLMFILATTELHKVPATILSRCQRFTFKRILPRDMEKHLLGIAQAEQIDLTPDGAEILARMANGALRDALSLLDQCRVAQGQLDSRAVLDILGLAGSARRPVSQLSGGMRRRVAIARAVCAGPQLLLLDEAFKGLDDQCRRDTVAYIRRHTPGASLLCVTHDPEEAALLGGRCLDLSTL